MNKFSFIMFLIITVIVFSGCSTEEQKNLNNFTGYIGIIDSENEPRILVIPNVKKDAFEGLSNEEIIQLAVQNEGEYFTIKEDEMDKLTKGLKVNVLYDASLGKEDSSPPIRTSEEVEIIKE